MGLKVQGFILIDVDGAALNNAGKSTASNLDNAVATKKIYKNGRPYAYVSGQAWSQWWRDTLQKNFKWELSPIIKDNKIAFTAADPMAYPDDDVFGYMKAAKDKIFDPETGEVQKDAKGKDKTEDVTVTRRSPLNTSIIVSINPVSIARNWSSMARQVGDSVPYVKEEYSACMKGQFSLDIAQVGTFSTYNKTGFKNLTEKLREQAMAIYGCEEIDDLFVLTARGVPYKLVQMPKKVRVQRIVDTIAALKIISGGAMQTNNMADVTPKFIILATMNSGNHPFGHIASELNAINELPGNEENETEEPSNNLKSLFVKVDLKIEAIKEVLRDYRDQFEGTVYIGKRMGFMDEHIAALKSLEDLGEGYPAVKFATVNEAIDEYCEQLKTQI
jgi:CRISPR-associated protein Cst2